MISRFSQNAIVFYHANCMDGFASAWAFKQWRDRYYSDVKYIPAKYEEPPHELLIGIQDKQNTDIYILDFSFNKSFLDALSKQFKQIFLYDHHKTAFDELAGWSLHDQPKNVHITIDPAKSGAGLCWYVFHEYEIESKLIKYVQDRDLWKFELLHSKEITEVIKTTPFDFNEYSTLNNELNENFPYLVKVGHYLRKQTDKTVVELAKLHRPCEFTFANGEHYNGVIVNAPPQFASDLGNYLCNTLAIEFSVSFYISEKKKYHYSLRSSKEKGNVDVSAIAKIFEGGGHRNAAGFVADYLVWN